MSKQIFAVLERKLNDLAAYGEVSAETKLNVLKEELQFYVLNFIYHHQGYSEWIMYGGSALRIIHGLDRMSVDLDFEVSRAVTEEFLEELKKEIDKHFANTYGTNADFLAIKTTKGRGLLLKFIVGEELSFGHYSKQIRIKIDLNHFIAPKTVTERRPINRNQFSFVIITYNMSSLMASKIAAILLRGTRGEGKATYEEKGRDIYDLLWYMNKKVVPDLDYLIAKKVDVKNLQALFNKLTIQMNKVSDENLKNDLMPLFVDQTYIKNWLKNWRESYFKLLDEYKINTITTLKSVEIRRESTGNFSFIYQYETEESGSAQIIYIFSEHWIEDHGDFPTLINISNDIINKISNITHFTDININLPAWQQKKLKRYAALFYQKTENYFKKTNKIILGDSITTKLIRMTTDNLNQKEQIVLNKSALSSCELDDLLK